MSHSPPIPEGNQSPYPIQEPPHVHQPKRETPVAAPSRSSAPLGVVLAIGAGTIIAAAAAFLFFRDAKPSKKSGAKRRRGS